MAKNKENIDNNKIEAYSFVDAKKQEWLIQYVTLGYNIIKACDAIKVSTSTFYAHLNTDEVFKKKFDETNEIALEAVTCTLLEALNDADWANRKWAVERLQKSRKLAKLGLAEVNNTPQQGNVVVNPNDIIIG